MSSNLGLLDSALHKPTTAVTREEIILALWYGNATNKPSINESSWSAYFAYYLRECEAALANPEEISIKTHRDLLEAAHHLQHDSTEDDIKRKLQRSITHQCSSTGEKRIMDGSIRLAVRILTMVNIGLLHTEVSGQLIVQWHHGSLQEAIHEHFNSQAEIDTEFEHAIFGSEITCRNIEHMTNIQVVPTDNLADHMRLVESGKKLCMFRHIAFLNMLKDSKLPLFPKGFAEETLDTLRLLLPENDRKTRVWLEDEFKMRAGYSCFDRGLLKCGYFKLGHPSRSLKHYKFWRDRLEVLKDTVEEATPPSKALLKALRDRKAGDRWLNSWVAMFAIGLTLFFGLVQSIEGAIQVYKAYHSS
ncbi:hypothetical protein ACN47E_004832 [Coniothyrium glycines]